MRFKGQRGRAIAHKTSHRRLAIEHLEDRRLMTISSFDAATGLLNVLGQSGDTEISITASNEATPRVLINGANPSGGPIAAAAVHLIHVTGHANTASIDLSAVTDDAFTAIDYTQIDFGETTAVADGHTLLDPIPSGQQNLVMGGAPEGSSSGGSSLAWPQDVDVSSTVTASKFSTLAVALIGADWTQKLGVSDANAFGRPLIGGHRYQRRPSPLQSTQTRRKRSLRRSSVKIGKRSSALTTWPGT